jgi:SAM-dependent methyltransferase
MPSAIESFDKQSNSWFQGIPGKYILKMEATGLNNVLPRLFGYFFLQLGVALDQKILADLPIQQHLFLNPCPHDVHPHNFIQANYDELPFVPESLDAALVLHILEFAKHPEKILAELYNALIPGGTALIFCFNPHSMMGLAKMWHSCKEFPWNGNFISPAKMRYMLNEVGFSVGDYQTVFFRPPLNNERLLHKLLFMETLGQLFAPYFGASYFFTAKKMVVGTKIIMPELHRHKVVTVGAAIR